MEHDSYYSPNLMVIGVFAGAGLTVGMATKTLITVDNITHVIILLSLCGIAFHYFHHKGGNKAFLQETVLFSICNWGLFGTGVLLTLNFLTAQPIPPEIHRVEEVKFENRRLQYVLSDGNPYRGFDYIIDFKEMNIAPVQGEMLVFNFSSGIFGLKIFEGVTVVNKNTDPEIIKFFEQLK